jgi:CO dehydrogenase maturation factor
MADEAEALAGERIGVFGKGGAGKSTVVVLLAEALRERGYGVCVLDADSTNVGLHRALGCDRSPEPLMEYFGGTIFGGGSVSCPVDDPTPLPGAEISLDHLPDKYCVQSPDGISLLTAGKIGGQGPGAGCDGPVSKIARDLRVHGNGRRMVTLIDFKAGLEDSARGVITSLDWVIVVIDPTNAGIQMAVDMKDMIARIQAGELPATRHLQDKKLVEIAERTFREATIQGVLFVLNKVRDEKAQNYLRRKLEENGVEPIGMVHAYDSIGMAWLTGASLEQTDTRKDAQRIAEKLEARASLAAAVGSAQKQ